MLTGSKSFIPERLTEAREARGTTMIELAELIGISRQSLSAYEKGRQVPSTDVLSKIANKLNLPVHFFLKPRIDFGNNPIYFRSLSAATQRSRKRMKRKLDWQREILYYLDHFVEFLSPNIPENKVDMTLTDSTFEEIENIATKCRRHWELGDRPISNLIRLLENNGVIISYQEFDIPHFDAFSRYNDIPIMILSADANYFRSRFNAAHELGHYIMHRHIKVSISNINIIEKQAHRFASAFLLPAKTFASDFAVPDLDTFCFLKNKWKVSVAAMVKRCHDLKFLTDTQASNLWKKISIRGWGKIEPLDDSTLPEQPVFLRKCLELILNHKRQTCEDIILGTALSSNDIETLMGLPSNYFKDKKKELEILPRLKDSGNKIIQFPGSRKDFNK